MNELKFRIKNIHSEDDKQVADSFDSYYFHLKSLNLNNEDALLKFFGYDFFHDGDIYDLKIFNGNRDVTFKVDALNIRTKESDCKDSEYVNTAFECIFRDVVWLTMEGKRVDALNDPLTDRGGLEFSYSEIDTLTEYIEHFKNNYRGSEAFVDDEPEFHSIIIRFTTPSGYFGMVFSSVSVVPVEPLAWHLLQESGKYELCLWDQ